MGCGIVPIPPHTHTVIDRLSRDLYCPFQRVADQWIKPALQSWVLTMRRQPWRQHYAFFFGLCEKISAKKKEKSLIIYYLTVWVAVHNASRKDHMWISLKGVQWFRGVFNQKQARIYLHSAFCLPFSFSLSFLSFSFPFLFFSGWDYSSNPHSWREFDLRFPTKSNQQLIGPPNWNWVGGQLFEIQLEQTDCGFTRWKSCCNWIHFVRRYMDALVETRDKRFIKKVFLVGKQCTKCLSLQFQMIWLSSAPCLCLN